MSSLRKLFTVKFHLHDVNPALIDYYQNCYIFQGEVLIWIKCLTTGVIL
ncbi:hypothetical protein SAMN02746093_02173 [Legionella quinlivanii DSM 21216]|nr:hypothetical protein SAMN02746093_02173 [Legionella quinlivanii DSM 21216]STY11095.1 Uncharacterised protein [Legionella quinlivanii]